MIKDDTRRYNRHNRWWYGLAVFCISCILLLAESVSERLVTTGGSGTGSDLEVHFIDVGQGNATLIRCGDHAMLIDAGENDKGTALQLYLQKQGIKKLDYLVLTHADADHIGGADVIITKFKIDTVFMSPVKKDTKTYKDVIQALSQRSLSYCTPKVGSVYELGDATFTILAPNDDYKDVNEASIAVMVKRGENTFLFTGDAGEEAEEDMMQNGLSLDADVYLAGHHGSRYSSSEAFLDTVTPEFTVLSCGEGNTYGHPHAQTLNNLRARGVKVFRTDEQGSIVAVSDGKEITWNCAPSETWQVSE